MWSDSEEFEDSDDEVEQGLYLDRLAMALRRGRSSSSLISSSWSSCSASLGELEQASSPALQCLVCLEHDVPELDCRPCCDQPVCRTCLKRYVGSKLLLGLVRIDCPIPACDSLVQVEELTRIEPELAQLYYRRLVDANADPHRKTCPNCCLVTELEPSQLNELEKSSRGLVINCRECQFRWCFRCHGPQLPGHRCDKNRATDDLLQKWAQPRRGAHRAQQCPVCKIYVERVSGCPHMECRMCKSQFCYFCGEAWSQWHLSICPRKELETTESTRRYRRRRVRRQLRKKLKTGGIVGGAVVGGVIAVPIVVGLAVPVAAVAVSAYLSYRLARRVKHAVR